MKSMISVKELNSTEANEKKRSVAIFAISHTFPVRNASS